MEFGEKLKELRKGKGLTQEELADLIFVSRTAVSKWESCRGYPSIELLKVIADFFQVSIDDLLSGEKLLSIAEKENKANIKKLCQFLFGIIDVLVILLIILPLYPQRVNGYVYAVQFFEYSKSLSYSVILHWATYVALFSVGVLKIVFTCSKVEKGEKLVSDISLAIGSLLVALTGLAREPYCVIVAFVLLVVKVILILKQK